MFLRMICAFVCLGMAGVAIAAQDDKLLCAFESASDCPGLKLDKTHVKQGTGAGRWERMDRTPNLRLSNAPKDWSAFNALSIWVYNERPVNAAFMMIVGSERRETDGADYYSLRFDLSRWTGWKQFIVPFSDLSAARQPRGWNEIDGVRFTASGYGHTPDPTAVVVFDDFRLLKLDAVTGPRLSEADFFAALNLDYPGLEAVKAAVARKDLTAAKAAWLAHLKARAKPRWHIDWHDRPTERQTAPAGGSPGWDYYSHGIKLDWTGWKTLRFTKDELKAARKPIGWNWIRYLSLGSTGFDMRPDPNVTLYIDNVRLVGPKGNLVLGDFEKGVGAWSGVEASTEQAADGKCSGKWAQLDRNHHVRLSDMPHDWSAYDAIELSCYVSQKTSSRIMLILDSDRPTFDGADAIAKHIIQGHDFGPDMDWSADPRHYREWTYAINRFFHWSNLGEAYWESGDEKYAQALIDQLYDWTRKNPVPLFHSGNGTYTWRTIDSGIRQSSTWPNTLYRLLGSPSFTPDACTLMTRSMVEHARHLLAWPSRVGNWKTMEANGLGTIGILLPECKEAENWRTAALAWDYAEIDNQVYPDGAQMELTTGYHQVALNNFLGLADTALLNDMKLPGDYYTKLRRMFEYNFWVQMPDGRTPALNDGGHTDIERSMRTAMKLYGDDGLFAWAVDRQKGTPPDHTSHFFPYAGQMAMRSGWEPDARYLHLDAGPFGMGHQHEDKLSIEVHAYGKVLVVDPGNYAYDGSPWRKYTIATPAHNTIMVDGLGQHRAGCPRETFVVKEPLASNVWRTSDKLDYAAGQYDEGYGPKNDVKVTHRRQVVFVKPDYWLVVDTLEAKGKHQYESLFHFDADEAEADAAASAVRTTDPGVRCTIAVAPQPGLSLRIVKGQTEPTVQGFIAAEKWRPSWKNPKAPKPEHGKREIPTAVVGLSATGSARLVYAIYPSRAGDPPAVKVADASPPREPSIKARVMLPGGQIDEIRLGDELVVTRQKFGSPGVTTTLLIRPN